MAKRSKAPRRRRRRTNYKFYKVVQYHGTQKLYTPKVHSRWGLRISIWIRQHGFLIENPTTKADMLTNKLRHNHIQGCYVNKFIDYMDRFELDELPENIELQDPTGRVIRRWSRVREWNVPSLELRSEHSIYEAATEFYENYEPGGE